MLRARRRARGGFSSHGLIPQDASAGMDLKPGASASGALSCSEDATGIQRALRRLTAHFLDRAEPQAVAATTRGHPIFSAPAE